MTNGEMPMYPNQQGTVLTEEPDIKPGVQTSEFWTSLVSIVVPNLVTVLVGLKIVPGDVASTLSTALVAVTGGIITIFVTIKYIKSRTEVKNYSLEIQDRARNRQMNMQISNKQFMLQLYEKGDIVTKEQLKKEFNV